MPPGVPFTRTKRIWWYMIPQIALLATLFYVFSTGDETYGMLAALVVYYLIIYLLRFLIASDHQKGISIIKSRNYEAAIRSFEKSADFFTRNAWVDKYRAITLLSASKKCYREMALCNIAYSYTQTQRGNEALALYEEILKEYPENDIAYSALKTLRSV